MKRKRKCDGETLECIFWAAVLIAWMLLVVAGTVYGCSQPGCREDAACLEETEEPAEDDGGSSNRGGDDWWESAVNRKIYRSLTQPFSWD